MLKRENFELPELPPTPPQTPNPTQRRVRFTEPLSDSEDLPKTLGSLTPEPEQPTPIEDRLRRESLQDENV
jgi:hypothetical protein